VSEVSSFFNIPLISWVATDPDFDDKVAYSTLSRTLGPFSKLADFLLEVFLQVVDLQQTDQLFALRGFVAAHLAPAGFLSRRSDSLQLTA